QMVRRREAHRPGTDNHDVIAVLRGHIVRTTLGRNLKSLSLARFPRESVHEEPPQEWPRNFPEALLRDVDLLVVPRFSRCAERDGIRVVHDRYRTRSGESRNPRRDGG